MIKKIPLLLLVILCGCASRTAKNENSIASLQILDRNGFSETISAEERLKNYQNIDFLSPQPYQKVLRVFHKTAKETSRSAVTTYHSNGQLWQYLEIENGRAHGLFREWHPNGKLRLEVYVIEGTADINEAAQLGWIFDGESHVWNDEGNLLAKINYTKGSLEGLALHYYPNGKIEKEIPYVKNGMHGTMNTFDEQGLTLEKIHYENGLRQGESIAYWDENALQYQENYDKGLLLEGKYYTETGNLFSEIKGGEGIQALFKNGVLSSTVEFRQGKPEGKIELFAPEGHILSSYHILEGKKQGEEKEYYPFSKPPQVRLSLNWKEDVIQGVVKTWYENGVLESQRDFNNNKKNGLSFAWFKEGGLMLMEEYEDDLLMKGSYFKKGEKKPTSKIENGKGVATLFDNEGHSLKKIAYEKGLPLEERGF